MINLFFMKSIFIFFSLLLGLSFQSCSKEESLSKEDKLTSGLWKYDSYTSTDPDETLEPCNFDNTWLFNKSGAGMLDFGDILCSESEQSGMLVWQFGESSDVLVVYDRWGTPLGLELISLSKSKLVFEQEIPDSIGIMTIVYKH